MKNIFSQRNKDRIYARKNYISKELRGQIYRLIERYKSLYTEESFRDALSELLVFYPMKYYNEQGEFVETHNFEKFIMNTNPVFVLDFIELFADNVNDEFANDINMLFINDKSKYRLENGTITETHISYPKIKNQGLDDLIFDIENNIRLGKYSLVLDRLHTYTSDFLLYLCKKRSLTPILSDGHIVIDGTFKQLKNFYEQKGVIQSKFSLDALTKATSLLSNYNTIRNNKSYAHPNKVLEQAEAKFVTQNICALIDFLGEIDKELDK